VGKDALGDAHHGRCRAAPLARNRASRQRLDRPPAVSLHHRPPKPARNDERKTQTSVQDAAEDEAGWTRPVLLVSSPDRCCSLFVRHDRPAFAPTSRAATGSRASRSWGTPGRSAGCRPGGSPALAPPASLTPLFRLPRALAIAPRRRPPKLGIFDLARIAPYTSPVVWCTTPSSIACAKVTSTLARHRAPDRYSDAARRPRRVT